MGLQRYHIGEIIEQDEHTTTIQPQGDPIPSHDGWWYPVEEVDKELSTLRRRNEELQKVVDAAKEWAIFWDKVCHGVIHPPHGTGFEHAKVNYRLDEALRSLEGK